MFHKHERYNMTEKMSFDKRLLPSIWMVISWLVFMLGYKDIVKYQYCINKLLSQTVALLFCLCIKIIVLNTHSLWTFQILQPNKLNILQMNRFLKQNWNANYATFFYEFSVWNVDCSVGTSISPISRCISIFLKMNYDLL